jgi:hypothetical protein
MKTKRTAGLIAVVLVFIGGAIPGLAQEAVSSPASEPVTPGETNQAPSVEELAKLKQNPVSGLRQGALQGVIGRAGFRKDGGCLLAPGRLAVLSQRGLEADQLHDSAGASSARARRNYHGGIERHADQPFRLSEKAG